MTGAALHPKLRPMRLVHLSDIHYLARMDVPPARFANKRLTGWLNLVLFRSFQHDSGMLGRIVEAVRAASPDHIAVTGDLTNLSLGVEFADLRLMLDKIGLGPDRITVIPGNHDRYTRGADRSNRIRAYLDPYMRGDPPGGGDFPAVRVREGVAVIGMDSCYARMPFLAGGRIGISQSARLESLLSRTDVQRSFPVILIHHPPYVWSSRPLAIKIRGLPDYPLLYRSLGDRNALVLHGHIHRNMYHIADGAGGASWRIVGVASATRHGRLAPYMLSTFHVFDVDRSGVRSIERYTLDPSTGGGYSVEDVREQEFEKVTIPGS